MQRKRDSSPIPKATPPAAPFVLLCGSSFWRQLPPLTFLPGVSIREWHADKKIRHREGRRFRSASSYQGFGLSQDSLWIGGGPSTMLAKLMPSMAWEFDPQHSPAWAESAQDNWIPYVSKTRRYFVGSFFMPKILAFYRIGFIHKKLIESLLIIPVQFRAQKRAV